MQGFGSQRSFGQGSDSSAWGGSARNEAAEWAAEEEKRRIMEERRRKKDEEWKRDMMGVQTAEQQERAEKFSVSQRFPHDTAVYVQRSNGSESIGFVHNFDPASGVYEIELDQRGSKFYKRCSEDMLRKAAANVGGPAASTTAALTKFPIGSRCFVARSNGAESLAFVREYDPATKLYKLELETERSNCFKNSYESTMRAIKEESLI